MATRLSPSRPPLFVTLKRGAKPSVVKGLITRALRKDKLATQPAMGELEIRQDAKGFTLGGDLNDLELVRSRVEDIKGVARVDGLVYARCHAAA